MSIALANHRATLGLIALALAAGCGSPPPPEGGDPVLPPTPAEFVSGETVYDNHCAVCHNSSRDGAPRLGFLRAWRERIEQGEATLVRHAIEGIGLMPPRGENPDLPDADMTEAVRYMIYRAKLDIPARH